MRVRERLDKIKDLFLRINRFVMVVSFAIWLIGGNIYNHFFTEQIQENKKVLLHELTLIEPLSHYESEEAVSSKGRALITQRYRKSFYLSEYTEPDQVIDQVRQHFLQRGWSVEEYHVNIQGLPHLEVRNDRYIVRMGQDIPNKQNSNRNVITVSISFNDILARMNF